MSSLTDKYTKNYSSTKRKEFEKRVFENLGNMSELSAIQLVLAEMRSSNNKGGRVRMASGGLINILKL